MPEDAAALVAFWIISTWFRDALAVLPCLAMFGPPHDATRLLRVLKDFCLVPMLLAELRRSDFNALRYGSRTLLISEPNLDKRTAALLGNLTIQDFMIVEEGWF